MKKNIELDVDYIGGLGELTKEEELELSKFFQERKLARENLIRTKRKTRTSQTKNKKIV